MARVSTAFRSLGAVFGAPLLPVVHAGRVQCAADDVIFHTRQILDPAAPDQHYRVLLEVVTFSWNICGYFSIITQSDTTNLAKRRVGLLGRHGSHLGANSALLRSALELESTLLQRVVRKLQVRRLRPLLGGGATLAHELTGGRQATSPREYAFQVS